MGVINQFIYSKTRKTHSTIAPLFASFGLRIRCAVLKSKGNTTIASMQSRRGFFAYFIQVLNCCITFKDNASNSYKFCIMNCILSRGN